jgi:hypothetical protein
LVCFAAVAMLNVILAKNRQATNVEHWHEAGGRRFIRIMADADVFFPLRATLSSFGCRQNPRFHYCLQSVVSPLGAMPTQQRQEIRELTPIFDPFQFEGQILQIFILSRIISSIRLLGKLSDKNQTLCLYLELNRLCAPDLGSRYITERISKRPHIT